ncbi:MAG: type II toxin-antitoxin system VapC family toxin [Deltaproteobacteria bacterium]|nr:MAG: type II toxin-antitoxin system VapC family toxin [Deltaproteobacteria bacterium]
MIVADSDVLIDSLRGRPAVEKISAELKKGTLATTVINCFELLSGARNERQREKIEKLLNAMDVLQLDTEAARRASLLRRQLESQGRGIGMADYLVAAICLERDAALLTRNLDHFSRVPGLKVLDPES